MIGGTLYILDFVFFLWIFLGVVYLLIFALYAQKRRPKPYPQARKQHPILVLFPAYKEDKVIRGERAFFPSTGLSCRFVPSHGYF